MRRYADLVIDFQLRSICWAAPGVRSGRDGGAGGGGRIGGERLWAAQRDSDRYWLLEYLRRSPPSGWRPWCWPTIRSRTGRRCRFVLTQTLLRANVAGRGLEPGQRIEVRLVKADPRRDMLKLEL